MPLQSTSMEPSWCHIRRYPEHPKHLTDSTNSISLSSLWPIILPKPNNTKQTKSIRPSKTLKNPLKANKLFSTLPHWRNFIHGEIRLFSLLSGKKNTNLDFLLNKYQNTSLLRNTAAYFLKLFLFQEENSMKGLQSWKRKLKRGWRFKI